MSARFIYEQDQLATNTIENYFSRFEGTVAENINGLIETIDKYKKDEEEFVNIKIKLESILPYLIIFYYRSGALLTEFAMNDESIKIPLLSKKILNKKYINSLASTIKECYKFSIIESDENFLLSDQFISTVALKIKARFANISNRHIGIKESLILIPISSKYYAAYWNSDNFFIVKENALNFLKDVTIKKFNQAIMNNSYSKCIGSSKMVLEEAIANYHWKSPSQVFFSYKSGSKGGFTRKKEVFFDEIDQEAYELFSDTIDTKVYTKVGRNDKCPCNSGKKYKKCHEKIMQRYDKLIENMLNNTQNKYSISNYCTFEKPIDQWGTT